jgi:predicted ArsR family transcriptional regulator
MTDKQLQERDAQVARLLDQDQNLTNGQIAEKLGLNYGEVRMCLHRMGFTRKNGRPCRKQVN